MAFNKPAGCVFFVHGKPEASEAFGRRMQDQFEWRVTLPRKEQAIEIDF